MYRFVDITILFYGLHQSYRTCGFNNRLSITSFSLLIFYLIDLSIIFYFLFKRNRTLSEEESSEELKRISTFRGFFSFLRLIPVAFGFVNTFKSSLTSETQCEIVRFTLGLVCFSTILMIIIPPTKPDLPTRRSFSIEIFLLICLLTINGFYFVTVGSAIQSVGNSSRCFLSKSEDFYLRSPLINFGQIGLFLYGFSMTIYILNLFVSQLTLRFIRSRRLFMSFHLFNYIFNYFISLCIVYYFSLGALLLFQPRSGEPCRTDSPRLYRTLIVWQWLRILAPLVAVPLILILCCLGVFFGLILSHCLPPSITVPILELLRGWLSGSPVQLNPNPPAAKEMIDAIPVILYGSEPDKFSQTECAICQTNYEANESLKKLPCEHLFHTDCITNWLSVTRICPLCRQKITND